MCIFRFFFLWIFTCITKYSSLQGVVIIIALKYFFLSQKLFYPHFLIFSFNFSINCCSFLKIWTWTPVIFLFVKKLLAVFNLIGDISLNTVIAYTFNWKGSNLLCFIKSIMKHFPSFIQNPSYSFCFLISMTIPEVWFYVFFKNLTMNLYKGGGHPTALWVAERF